MANLAPCGACSIGDHEHHIEHWNVALPGVLGGTYCACTGDCKPNPALAAIFQSFAFAATETKAN